MRHRVFGNQLGRNTKQARALYRALLVALFNHGRIETTLARAKAVRGEIDRLVNLAKIDSVAARRQIIKILGKDLVLPKSFSDRHSGYSRIIHLHPRLSDTAERVILELIADAPKVKDDDQIVRDKTRKTRD